MKFLQFKFIIHSIQRFNLKNSFQEVLDFFFERIIIRLIIKSQS